MDYLDTAVQYLNKQRFKDTSSQQFERDRSLGQYIRNLPSHPLQCYFESRPIDAKRCRYDKSGKCTEIFEPETYRTPVVQRGVYDAGQIFNPGCRGPWSGYAHAVNVESDLRNLSVALQRAPQAYMAPSSNSDMFTHRPHCPLPTPEEKARYYERLKKTDNIHVQGYCGHKLDTQYKAQFNVDTRLHNHREEFVNV